MAQATTVRKWSKEFLAERRLLGGRAMLIGLGSLPLIAIVVLLLIMAPEAFHRTGVAGLTLENFRLIYTDPFVYTALLNTVAFTAVTVAVAAFFGIIVAWLVERTDLPSRGLIFPLMTVGLVMPGFMTAMGWLLLFDQRIGVINQWLVRILPFLHQSPLKVGTLVGMGIVQGISLTGLMFIMVAAAFRAMDPTLEESADVHGVGFFSRMWKITIPLAWPGIIAACIYIAAIGFAAFDIPAIIGMGSRIFTFSTFLYREVNPDSGALPQYGVAAAASGLMLILAIAFSIWYLRMVRRANRYAVVTGKNYRPKLYHLSNRGIAFAWSFVTFIVLFTLVLPFLVLVWASITPYFQPPSIQAFSHVTLSAYHYVSWSLISAAVKNTLILTIAVPTLTAIFGLLISWVVTRSQLKTTSGAFDILAFIPHVVPSIIFAIGAILLALFYLPHFVPFYGTLAILVVVYMITRISFATRVYNASFVQIHHELDEAGYVFGLKRITVLRKILGPLLTPAVLYTWIWMALLAYRELTLAAMLVSRNNEVISLQAWQLWQNQINYGAAITVEITVAMLPILAIYFIAARRVVGRTSV